MHGQQQSFCIQLRMNLSWLINLTCDAMFVDFQLDRHYFESFSVLGFGRALSQWWTHSTWVPLETLDFPHVQALHKGEFKRIPKIIEHFIMFTIAHSHFKKATTINNGTLLHPFSKMRLKMEIDSTQDTCEDPKQYPHKSWRPWFCQCHKHCKSKRRPTPYYLGCRHVQFEWTIMSPWIQRGQNGHNFTWKRTDHYCSHISHTHPTQIPDLFCNF